MADKTGRDRGGLRGVNSSCGRKRSLSRPTRPPRPPCHPAYRPPTPVLFTTSTGRRSLFRTRFQKFLLHVYLHRAVFIIHDIFYYYTQTHTHTYYTCVQFGVHPHLNDETSFSLEVISIDLCVYTDCIAVVEAGVCTSYG